MTDANANANTNGIMPMLGGPTEGHLLCVFFLAYDCCQIGSMRENNKGGEEAAFRRGHWLELATESVLWCPVEMARCAARADLCFIAQVVPGLTWLT